MIGPRSGRRDVGPANRTTGRYDPEEMRWVSGFVALVGLWIAVSPFLYEPSALARWNNLLVGGGIATVATGGFLLLWQSDATYLGTATLVALLGLWSLVAPLVVPFGDPGLAWSTVGAGGLVALVGGYHAYALVDTVHWSERLQQ